MPHLLIHCSASIIHPKPADNLIRAVNDAALATDLFKPETIKVRIQQFEFFSNGGTDGDFIHVFAHIMEGRNSDQKSLLTSTIINRLEKIYPNVPYISVNVIDMDKTSYRKKSN